MSKINVKPYEYVNGKPTGEGCVIFWDIDGTLVMNPDGDEDLFRSALMKTAPGLNLVESLDRHGKTDARIINDYLVANKLPPDEYTATMRELLNAVSYNFFTSPETGGREAVSGAKEVVEICASLGFTNAILTGNSKQRAELKLTSAGFPLELFDWELSEFGDEEMVRAKLAENITTKEQFSDWGCITIVGDTPADVHAAQHASLQCYAVATGAYSVEELRAAGATKVAQNLMDNVEDLILYMQC